MTQKKLEVAVIPFQNLVLYPSACIPLYIFDPIYIKLIEDCIRDQRLVALALSDPALGPAANANSLYPRKICGVGQAIMLQEYPDKTKYVLIEGKGKVSLGRPAQELPYLICEANWVPETGQEMGMLLPHSPIERLKNILDDWLCSNIKDSEQRHAFIQKIQSASHIVDYLSTFLVSDREVKQILLEAENLNERIQMLNLLLAQRNPFQENSHIAKILKSYEYLEKTGRACEN